MDAVRKARRGSPKKEGMSLFPPIATREAWRFHRAQRASWLPALAEMARRHGLPPPRLEDIQPAGDVVAFAGEHVLKLTAPLFIAEHAAERAALECVAHQLGVPTPAVVATGELEGWPYLVLQRLPGVRAGDVWPRLGDTDRRALLAELGAVLAALHRVRVSGLDVLSPHWAEFLASRRAASVEHHRRMGMGDGWLLELEGYLEETAPLLEAEPADCLLHADLTDSNLLVGEGPHGWRMTALIDFGDARLGAPGFDLAVPALFLVRGDAGLLDALLSGYGVPRGEREHWPRRLLSHALLHPFSDMSRFVDPASAPARLRELAPLLFPLT